jgi:hypothetical protein
MLTSHPNLEPHSICIIRICAMAAQNRKPAETVVRRNGEEEKTMQEKRNDKEHLIQVCRQRFRGAKAEAAAIAAKRRSEFEALLKEIYSLDNQQQLFDFVVSAIAKANEELACLVEQFAMPHHFYKLERSEDDAEVCLGEDRWRAEQKIGRLEREAAAQIERTSMDTLIQLMDEHLRPDEATALVHAIPAAAELIPELNREDLKRERDAEKDIPEYNPFLPQRSSESIRPRRCRNNPFVPIDGPHIE